MDGMFDSELFSAVQLTLSHPRGHIMPTTLLCAPAPRFSDLSTALDTLLNVSKNEYFPSPPNQSFC